MGTDLTFIAGSAGYDLPCHACGAGCRPIDRFCSQCGIFNPTGSISAELEGDIKLDAPTIITVDEPFPDLDATYVSPNAAEGTVVDQRYTTRPRRTTAGTRRRRERDAAAQKALEAKLVPGGVFARRYRIQKFLGAGAMGHVCAAIDDSIDETVALKILSVPMHEDPAAFERFKMELKLARRIRHRNVVQSFDLGFADGYPYISMEYIDADNLSKHLERREKFDEVTALGILRQVLRGLRAAHALGIVHRDIKPENVLLNKDGVAFITDFGIATSADRARKREIAGTPDYMAPEQLRGQDVGPTADLYACGVMLYRMVSGTLPFKAKTLADAIDARLNEKPRPIKDKDVSPPVHELIDSLLQREVRDRPQSADEVLDRIEAILRERNRSTTRSMRVTVLAAIDDPSPLAFVQQTLEADGYRVIPANNAREAVNLAFEQNPTIILLDADIRGGFDLLSMEGETDPGLLRDNADSVGFLRIVREDAKLRRVPIVVLSKRSDEDFRTTFASIGAADFLVEPLTTENVLDSIRRQRTMAE